MAATSVRSGIIEEINVDSSNNLAIASTAYGICETDASTATKNVLISGFVLKTGVTIHVKFTSRNSAPSPKLKFNGESDDNAKLIKLYGSTAFGTDDGTTGWYAGAVVSFTYDGTYWIRDQGFNTNENNFANRIGHYNNVLARANIAAESLIVGDITGYEKVGANVTFDIAYPILWTTGKIDLNTSNYSNVFIQHYDRNIATGAKSGFTSSANAIIYLIVTINGNIATIDSNIITDTLPESDDGKVYIALGKLGNQSTGANYFFLYPTHTKLWYKGGKICEYDGGTGISNVIRSSNTFTVTRTNGTTFTFTQKDTWNALSTSQAGYVKKAPNDTTKFLRGDADWAVLPTASTDVYGITKLYNNIDSTSTSLAATANAVKTAYDQATTALNTANNVIDAADALVFKGTIGAGGTVETLPDTHSIGWTYKAIEDATFAGKVCEIGDLIICVADGTTENNDDWTIVQENINGYIHFYNNHNNNIDSLISTPYLQTAAKQGGNWTGTKPTGSHNGVALFNFQTHSGNYYTQLALDTSGNRLWLRSANNATTFGAWAKIATIADIEALDGNLNNTAPGAGKTLTAFLQTDGKVSATFDDISITKSQISDFSHTHGNITNDGKIGSTADYAVYTTTGGAITAGSLATDAPTASGTALSFITSVSQNSKGKISANKATVATFIKSGNTAAAGLVPKPDTTAGTGKFLCEDGTWKTPSYTANTDKKLDQTLDSSSTDTFPLLFSDNNTTVTTATINSSAKRNNNIYIKPSTGQLNSTEFVVNAHARLTYNSTIKSLDFILI